MKRFRIYVDMDGTIADIHGEKDWFERAKKEKDFFEKLAPFNNLIVALYLLKIQYKRKVKICSLSSVEHNGRKNHAVISKHFWLDLYAAFIKKRNRIFSIVGMPKSKYVKRINKRAILLDDHTPNLIDWENHGGYAIKVKNNINCSGNTWTGDIIYNQDSISAILTKLDDVIRKNIEA